MTINPIVSRTPTLGPTLDAFSAATSAGDAVYISVSGQSMQVLGTGVTPSGRSVAWVAPDVDTASMFTNALARTYGQGIAITVAKELGLEPSPGKPLSSRVVALGLDMAQTSSEALSGVDFAVRMDTSATIGGQGFVTACRALGLDPSSVDSQQRKQIDEAMALRFDQAAMRHESPVRPETAQIWLRELLSV